MSLIDERYFTSLIVPRPVGSCNNTQILYKLKETALQLGYDVEILPFDCKTWEKGNSFIHSGEFNLAVHASPFSPSFHGEKELLWVKNITELRNADLFDKIVVIHGDLAAEQLMPKGFPFYFPPEHAEIYELLESGRSAAILSATGKHPMCGLDPYAMFEDCRFLLPSAYFSSRDEHLLQGCKKINLAINSQVIPAKSGQLIIRKAANSPSAPKIVFCAHMDTAYNTPGALDNASGLAVLLQMMERLQHVDSDYTLEFVPFNGEDYCEVSGQMAYLSKYPIKKEECRLVVNIDDAGHKDSLNALSLHNVDKGNESLIETLIANDSKTIRGAVWYESDHTMFVQQGVPCLVFASSNLLETTVQLTHTPEDTVEQVDFSLIEAISSFTVNLLQVMQLVK